jgi:16S rRNA G1207 methylase RsmC
MSALAGEYAAVTCVDLNPRAVRFARFNAALNGLEPPAPELQQSMQQLQQSCNRAATEPPAEGNGRVGTVDVRLGDLATAATELQQSPNRAATEPQAQGNGRVGTVDVRLGDLYGPAASCSGSSGVGDDKFDILLANPPFVPVPPALNAQAKRIHQ